MSTDPELIAHLAQTADRLDELADVAELMDDDEGALRLRHGATSCRDRAMALLDRGSPESPT